MTNPWNALPDDVRELIDVAVEEFARRAFDVPLPEEHICDFAEIVATEPDAVYRCVLTWSDGTRCNSFSSEQRVHARNRYLARPAGDPA